MANTIQAFSVNKYVRNYINPLLRKPSWLGLNYALFKPLQSYRDRLVNITYPDLERRARYNAQVARFEYLLNYIFNTGTAIYIDEAGVPTRLFSYNKAEIQPVYAYNKAENLPLFSYNQLEFIPVYDFTVHIPQALYNTDLIRVRAEVKKRSLAGVTFTIVPY